MLSSEVKYFEIVRTEGLSYLHVFLESSVRK